MHFSVLVIGDDVSVEEQLHPFYEGLEIEPVLSLTKEEFIQTYRLELPNSDSMTDGEVYEYAVEDYTNGKKELICPDTGGILSYTNPNAKWDWWEVGGRWWDTLRASDDMPDSLFEKYISKVHFSEREPDILFIKEDIISNKYVSAGPLKFISNIEDVNTYAILYKGVWIEKDHICDLGQHLLEPELRGIENLKEFKEKLLSILDPDTLITLVDCHV